MAMRMRDVVIDRDEADLIIQALKLCELADAETDMTRSLIRRFRRVRALLAAHEEPDTAEAQATIFSAGEAA